MKRRSKTKLSKQLTKSGKGSFDQHIFVSSDRSKDKSEARLNILIRTTVSVVIVAAIVALLIFVFGYVIPMLQDEFSVGEDPNQTSEFSNVELDQQLEYDKNGLPIYNNEINLFVINAKKPATETFVPDTKAVNGVQVDKRIAPSLQAMLDALKDDGYKADFALGYVPYTQQELFYNARVEALREEEGTTVIMAKETAKKTVSAPGESDFQTGLCVKLKTDDKAAFKTSQTYEWLKKNMGDYGYIFRYPEGKDKYTEMEEDYTVLRYVGVENAKKIRQSMMCLEEYLIYLDNQKS